MVDHPSMVGLPSVDVVEEDEEPIVEQNLNDEENDSINENAKEEEKPVSFISALRIPGVIEYALSYFALKMVNYSFFFWLPYYLHNTFHWDDSTSNSVSTWFDVGGIIGGVVGGIGSDIWGHRSPVVFGMALAAIPSLLGLRNSPNNKAIASVLMTVVGIFIGGASNMIGAACAADLGKAAIDMGMSSAVATVTGIIDGTGSVGAAVGQIAIPLMEENIGWDSVFVMFMVMSALSALALVAVVYRELKDTALCRCFRRSTPPIDD